jgi:hypothetical protein
VLVLAIQAQKRTCYLRRASSTRCRPSESCGCASKCFVSVSSASCPASDTASASPWLRRAQLPSDAESSTQQSQDSRYRAARARACTHTHTHTHTHTRSHTHKHKKTHAKEEGGCDTGQDRQAGWLAARPWPLARHQIPWPLARHQILWPLAHHQIPWPLTPALPACALLALL